jgi:hypothetical protein
MECNAPCENIPRIKARNGMPTFNEKIQILSNRNDLGRHAYISPPLTDRREAILVDHE